MPKIVKETLETVSDNVQNLGIENEALDPNGNLYLNFFLCSFKKPYTYMHSSHSTYLQLWQ